MLSALEMELKTVLVSLSESGYTASSVAKTEALLDAMVANIGCLDSELRDSLIYRSFYKLLFNGAFDAPLIKRVLYQLLRPEYIEREIEKPASLSVFARSFSMLFIDVILEWDKTLHILQRDDVSAIYAAAAQSYRKEHNVKGYYKKFGWAHTVAHSADTFADLVGSMYIGEKEIIGILQLIADKFITCTRYLIDGEDERTANVIVSILHKSDGYQNMVSDWMARLARPFGERNRRYISIKRGNVRNLLRSIYFKIENEPLREEIVSLLSIVSFS